MSVMNAWVIPLLTAIGGAGVALAGQQFFEWYRRPRLAIGFEESDDKPTIADLNDVPLNPVAGYNYKAKCFRLRVRNVGRKPAIGCEAKLELWPAGKKPSIINRVVVRWARRDPILYRDGNSTVDNAEKIFAPLDLNIHDEELLSVFRLPYIISTRPGTGLSPSATSGIESESLWHLAPGSNGEYQCRVTVYSGTASPASFGFKVCWNGTLEGFDTAFSAY